MTVTCIISQFDFKAGTSGDGDCILSGNERPANPITNKEMGLLIEPIIEVFVFDSRNIVIEVIPHAKNNKDSYKLLKGK